MLYQPIDLAYDIAYVHQAELRHDASQHHLARQAHGIAVTSQRRGGQWWVIQRLGLLTFLHRARHAHHIPRS